MRSSRATASCDSRITSTSKSVQLTEGESQRTPAIRCAEVVPLARRCDLVVLCDPAIGARHASQPNTFSPPCRGARFTGRRLVGCWRSPQPDNPRVAARRRVGPLPPSFRRRWSFGRLRVEGRAGKRNEASPADGRSRRCARRTWDVLRYRSPQGRRRGSDGGCAAKARRGDRRLGAFPARRLRRPPARCDGCSERMARRSVRPRMVYDPRW